MKTTYREDVERYSVSLNCGLKQGSYGHGIVHCIDLFGDDDDFYRAPEPGGY